MLDVNPLKFWLYIHYNDVWLYWYDRLELLGVLMGKNQRELFSFVIYFHH